MTPVILRGKFYNTRFVRRCPAFSECHICHQCTNYNKNLANCVYCESSKNPDLLCRHTDEQQNNLLKVNMALDRPLFHVDDDLSGPSLNKAVMTENEMADAEDALRRMNIAPQESF